MSTSPLPFRSVESNQKKALENHQKLVQKIESEVIESTRVKIKPIPFKESPAADLEPKLKVSFSFS